MITLVRDFENGVEILLSDIDPNRLIKNNERYRSRSKEDDEGRNTDLD